MEPTPILGRLRAVAEVVLMFSAALATIWLVHIAFAPLSRGFVISVAEYIALALFTPVWLYLGHRRFRD
jgi:hypothetical protein